MAEQVFLSTPNAQVTSARVSVLGKVYALSAITSVEVTIHQQSFAAVSVLIGFAAIVIMGCGGMMPFGLMTIASFITGIGLLVGIGFVNKNNAPMYQLKLVTSAAEVLALESPDQHSIMEVKDAIENAIIHRAEHRG